MHRPGESGQAVQMSPHPSSGCAGDGGRRPRTRRLPRRGAARVAVAAGLVVVAVVLVAAARGGIPGAARGTGAESQGGMSRAVLITAGPVGTVELAGVPGQVTIVGTTAGRVELTGQLHWTGHPPVSTTRLDRAAGVLQLSYRCAPASPCTENYRLAVPSRTAIVLRQPSGHVIMSGLDGALRIIARSVDVSATRLRSASLVAQISSGHLDAAFEAPPRHVGVTLTSAQATLWLPADVRYAVSSQVSAGYIHVGVPRASTATRTVTVRIASGELELLPR